MKKTITVDATEDALELVNDFWQEQAEALDAAPKALFQIELAVEEIFVNIVSYAYQDDATKNSPLFGRVEVGCEVSEDPASITLCFTDGGTPFDPLQTADADTSGKMFMERAGGFGIHLVKETMDEVTYAFSDGKNILSIRKNL